MSRYPLDSVLVISCLKPQFLLFLFISWSVYLLFNMSYMVYILLIWFMSEYPTKGLMRFYIFINFYINVFLGQGVGYVLNETLPKFR